ncbi:MAG: transketolase [Pseudomonadota bacterium]
MPATNISQLKDIESRVLWLASWMIHNANALRESEDGDVKVGGHQASSASLVTIMTALYFAALRAQDRVAVKPHASPVYHAIQYLAGKQTVEKLKNFRGFGGAQSYPSRTKDGPNVDFSTGSVGLGVAQTLFSSLVQDYIVHQGGMAEDDTGRMVALIGDAEMDEGNIYEALFEGWKHGLRNCWWIIDYNRQSLDAVVREGLFARFEDIFRGFGWNVVTLRHGHLQTEVFAKPGGADLQQWIEACPNQLYSALTFKGAQAWRDQFSEDFDESSDVAKLIASLSDDQLTDVMGNLGGHDIELLMEAFSEAAETETPTLFLCYTIKGHGLPLAGHKDNHAGLMTTGQMGSYKQSLGIRDGYEWEPWEGAASDPQALQGLVESAPFFERAERRLNAPKIDVPDELHHPKVSKMVSTQMGFGTIMHEIAKEDTPFSNAIVTTSPDVTVSTNLGGWVNRRGLFSKTVHSDVFKDEKIPSTYKWHQSSDGQHFELGIAESNLFLMLSALGLSHDINGQRILPVGTVYDPFIYRAADQMNYACYQDARFMLVATPSGVTLAPEGGAHQSIGTPLVGMAQDRMASFEPAFIDELALIMRFGFDFMQRDGGATDTDLLEDETGGSVYLRLSTRPVEQPHRTLTTEQQDQVIEGGYWLRHPGSNPRAVIAYTGVVAPEAIEAAGRLAGDVRDVGVLAVTSADRLHKGWAAAQRRRQKGDRAVRSHVETLMQDVDPGTPLVTVCDAHPATLSWLGSVQGHRTRGLGVETFGQTGTIADLYRSYGIDASGIISAIEEISPGRPCRV